RDRRLPDGRCRLAWRRTCAGARQGARGSVAAPERPTAGHRDSCDAVRFRGRAADREAGARRPARAQELTARARDMLALCPAAMAGLRLGSRLPEVGALHALVLK